MGWMISKGLAGRDLRAMEHAFHVAERAGYPMNGFLTLTPPREWLDDERVRRFRTFRGHLGQKLARAGFPFVGLLVREKKLHDDMEAGQHLHGLLYLPDRKALRLVRGFEHVKAEFNHGPDGAFRRLLYCQKERDARCEAYRKHKFADRPYYQWEEPAPIVGQRWSVSKALGTLIQADDRGRKVYPVRTPTLAEPPPIIVGPTKEHERYGLFNLDDLPAMPPAARVGRSATRVRPKLPAPSLPLEYPPTISDLLPRLGPTDTAIARRIGISRPHVTNVRLGQFNPSRAVVRCVLELARAA